MLNIWLSLAEAVAVVVLVVVVQVDTVCPSVVNLRVGVHRLNQN
jgi:hypothetical protein